MQTVLAVQNIFSGDNNFLLGTSCNLIFFFFQIVRRVRMNINNTKLHILFFKIGLANFFFHFWKRVKLNFFLFLTKSFYYSPIYYIKKNFF